ncbi:hypothetical protein ABTB22_19500, partial [Acinetobacter baumannii]
MKLPTFNDVNWRDWKTYVLLLPVIAAFILWKPLEALRSRVYEVGRLWWSVLFEVLALPAAIAAAI